jgi:O-antigen/teichoic acid export membrane protein
MQNTLLSRFISNVISSGLGRVFIVVFGLLCMLIYARWMPSDEYGGFVLFQVLINLGLSFGEFGMNTVTTRFIASTENVDERRKIINTGFYFRISSMILISLVIFIFQDSLYQILGGYIPKNLLVYLPFMLLIEGLLSFYTYVLEGMINFNILAVINFTYGLTSLILTAVLVIPFKMGALGLVWARFAPTLLCLTIAIIAAKMKLQFEFDWDSFKKMVKFAIPLYGNNLLAFTYNRADTFIIGYFFGPAEIAIFEFARRIPESLEMLYGSFNDVYFPFISNLFAAGNKQRISEMINHANRITGFLGGLAVLLAFGFGDLFFRVVFSEKYLSSVPAFNILMIVLIFKALDANLGYSLVAIGEPDKPLYINIFRFGIILTSYFLLIPRLNIVGAVLSSLIGLLLVNPINVFFLRRRSLDVKMDVYVKPLLLLTLGIIPYYFIGSNILVTLIFMVVFVGGCYFTGILRIDDFRTIRKEALVLISRVRSRKSGAE